MEEKIVERAQRKLYLDAVVIQQGRLVEQDKQLDKTELQSMIRFGADAIFHGALSRPSAAAQRVCAARLPAHCAQPASQVSDHGLAYPRCVPACQRAIESCCARVGGSFRSPLLSQLASAAGCAAPSTPSNPPAGLSLSDPPPPSAPPLRLLL